MTDSYLKPEAIISHHNWLPVVAKNQGPGEVLGEPAKQAGLL